ncbi:MAG: type II secretion system F family protein [Gemmatimonadaceae bacterium]
MQLIALTAVFASVIGLIVGLYTLVNRRNLAMQSAARSRLVPDAGDAPAAMILREEESASALPFLNRLLSGREVTDDLAVKLRRAGTSLTPGAFLLITTVSAGLGILVGSRLGNIGRLVGVVFGIALPLLWLRRKERKRLEAFEQQLPDAIDMLVSALKSGYSFHAATNFLGQELGEPLGPEFARMYDEQRLGIDARTALLNLQEHVGGVDIRMFVTALLIQRETGGNLSEVLSNTGQLMRDRVAVRGALNTLTAEAKLSGRILALLPVFVFFALSLIAPEFMGSFTGSAVGQFMLLGASVSIVIGYAIMMKIANVEF